MNYYYDKIDEYGDIAEEALEEIPVDIDEADMRRDYWDSFNRYEDCLNLIRAIRGEIGLSYDDYP